MNKKSIIFKPYQMLLSGYGFPIGKGTFISIPDLNFKSLFLDANFKKENLYISTSNGYCFVNISDYNISKEPSQSDLNNLLTLFRYYNCNTETGRGVRYWLDIGDLTEEQESKLIDYYTDDNMRYSTLIKQYLSFLQNK